MKKYLFALAACAAIAAADVRADFGTPPAPAQGGGAPAGGANTYGWNPILKRVMFWKKKDDCSTGSCNTGSKCGPGGCAPQAPAAGLPGTLVFPTHPFNRSPRDYFMYGHGGN